MCGVVGVYSKNNVDLEKLQILLKESQIRGKHATGVAWIENNKIKYDIVKYSADRYQLPNIKSNMVIAHCRYSTSDLEWNQPIVDNDIAVVHNGVVTQADPSRWESMYKMKFSTKCDSEILLRHWQKNIHALHIKGSMACLVLDTREKPVMHFFRNEQRPLYYAKDNDDYYVVSTANILQRCKISNAKKAECCIDYKIIDCQITETQIRKPNEDLQ